MHEWDKKGVNAAHLTLWVFRDMHAQYWPTPNPRDSMRYAFCEAGEALDARLRAGRPGDARNTERDVSEADELADVVIMLLTAIGPVCPDWKYPADLLSGQAGQDLDILVMHVASVMGHIVLKGPALIPWEQKVWILAVDIAHYLRVKLGEPLFPLVESRLNRIWKKHVAPGIAAKVAALNAGRGGSG